MTMLCQLFVRNETQRLLVCGVPKKNPVDLVTAVLNQNEQLRHSCSINKVDQLGSRCSRLLRVMFLSAMGLERADGEQLLAETSMAL